jgi:hypothetical protein
MTSKIHWQVIRPAENKATIELSRGMSILVPSALRSYTIEGIATVYRTSVPP